jgi:hypothetical protein
VADELLAVELAALLVAAEPSNRFKTICSLLLAGKLKVS